MTARARIYYQFWKTKMEVPNLKISYGQNKLTILECMRVTKVKNHTG